MRCTCLLLTQSGHSLNGIYGILTVWSLRFDARELDHLAPLLDFIADEFGKLAGAARRRRYDAEFDEPLPDPRVAKGGIDQLVERRDDVGRRGRGAEPIQPSTS